MIGIFLALLQYMSGAGSSPAEDQLIAWDDADVIAWDDGDLIKWG